ncbi:hypothetical protein [Spirosoma aerophilum]
MNSRIRSDDLEHSPYKEVVQSLVYQWVRAELPAHGLTYLDYTMVVKTLLLTTQNPDWTSTVVRAVLRQALTLRKTSAWVEQELKFEGMIDGVDRADFLLLDLQQADTLDDALLDSYNERMNRFTATD